MKRTIHNWIVAGGLMIVVAPVIRAEGTPPSYSVTGIDVAKKGIERPSAPASGAYSIQAKHWYLIGDARTPSQDTFTATITGPAEVSELDLRIDDSFTGKVTRSGESFVASADIASLIPGEHRASFFAQIQGSMQQVGEVTFTRTYPYYVFVSNDWDNSDHSDNSLSLQEQLHKQHPSLCMTHFVGPYTFTDPEVSANRASTLVNWVKGMELTYGDEIGLHIHPWRNFVETTAVKFRSSPSFAYYEGDSTGYTVNTSAYTEDEYSVLLQKALSLFAKHGLGRPVTFRAGGWTSEIHTLRALEANGFFADASGANWRWLTDWTDAPLYPWCTNHWSTINNTSQPYFPSTTDILQTGDPALSILEVPDNGILADYITGNQMFSVFKENWPGGKALTRPTVLSIGYHPASYESYHTRMERALTYIDRYLADRDLGPVVYTTLKDLVKVYRKMD